MSYSLKLKNEVKKIYYNVINLLEDRGYTSEVLGKYISIDVIDFKIHNFLESDDGDSTYIDLFIPGVTKTYVKFFKSEAIDKSVKYGTKQKFTKSIDFIKHVVNLNETDNIIFVLIDSMVTKEARKSLNEIESNHPYLRIFSHRDLLINIARHSLVPEHKLYNKNKNLLFKKLMINNNNQLPYILHSDPISRYYNFRHNDIVEVLRPTKTDGFHKVYRVCIDLDSKTKDTTIIKKPNHKNTEAKMGDIYSTN